MKSFAPNGHGLYDTVGNVSQSCIDWYRPDYFRQLAAGDGVARNPQGHGNSVDPGELRDKSDLVTATYHAGFSFRGDVN